ncbi:MAG: ACT domain-containing protein [Euryarchaeota archaeon]|nr:ACT domain-containing protein [Euryarchaeota archaeon]
MMIQQFEIFVQNKPGDVSRIAEALSRNSVNIRGISTDLGSPRPMIRVITDDEASTRSALRAANMEFSEREIDVVSLPDRPGELAKMTKLLSRSGINIESLFILGTHGNNVNEIAIATDDSKRAREILSKYF